MASKRARVIVSSGLKTVATVAKCYLKWCHNMSKGQGDIMVKKQSNFQLLKIVAMLMIVAHHLVSKNAFNVDTEIVGLTANKLLLQILGNNAFIGNNLFFLISAWFLSSKAEDSINIKYSFSSCVRLERIVLFYSISLLCLSLIFNRGGVSLILVLKSIFPTLFGLWWYPTTYIVFLLMWPFYHKGLKTLDDDNLKKCIVVMFGVWSVSTLIPYVDLGSNNFCAFLMLYAAVAYIKRKRITYSNYKKQCVGVIIIPYLLAALSIIVLDVLGIRLNAAATYSCYYIRGNFRPVSMLVSIGLFMWGTTWKLKPNKIIDWLADATFGIYLFHMYPPVMKILFERDFLIRDVIDKPYAVLWLIVITMVIFLLGLLIDTLRKALFNVCSLLLSRIQARNSRGV